MAPCPPSRHCPPDVPLSRAARLASVTVRQLRPLWLRLPTGIGLDVRSSMRPVGYNRQLVRCSVRILLLSDIHANLEALDACLANAPSFDVAVNLGDIVGYGASPNEVSDRSRAIGTTFVRGNHDKAATGGMELEDFNPMAAAAALWTRNQLTPENLDWLRALPHGPVPLPNFPDVQLVHGSPNDEDEYVVSLGDALAPLITLSIPLTFFGHTHLQGGFLRQRLFRRWIPSRIQDCRTGRIGATAAQDLRSLSRQSGIA